VERSLLEEHLAMAERHVAEGEVHLLRQRRLVSDLRRDGHDTAESEKFLAQLEALQVMHLEHRDHLRSAWKAENLL
jgi:hypothetical protein